MQRKIEFKDVEPQAFLLDFHPISFQAFSKVTARLRQA